MADAIQPKKRTIAEWQKLYSDELERRDRAEAQRDEARGNYVVADKRNKELREQFDDLKQRLVAAEQANQFMRGYVARVQEDDVVREELIATGDTEGEQRLVPKRKPTVFERPDDFTEPRRRGDSVYGGFLNRDDRPKPKHWVTY